MCLEAYAFIFALVRVSYPFAVALLGCIEALYQFFRRIRVGICFFQLIQRLLSDLIVERCVVLADKLLLYLLQNFLLPLLKCLDVPVGCHFDDSFDLIDKGIEVDHGDFVINPVGLALMESLYYFMVLLVLSLAIVLDQFHQIAILEVSAHPILLLAILQNTMSLKHVVFELAHIQISIFEHLFAHSVQLGIDVVSSLYQPKLKLVLVAVSIWIVSSVWASIDKVEAKPINEAILLEANQDAIALLLRFDHGYLLKLVLDDLRVGGSNQKVYLSEVKHAIEYAKVIFF